MSAHEERRTFVTLDGLRGMAAILVVGRHVGLLGHRLGPTYLAVDLFFFLSGFVIALAYDGRLQQGGFFRQFLAIRFIRLYPLYLLGLALGLLAYVVKYAEFPTVTLANSVLMIPSNPITPAGEPSLNIPVWTLPLELAVNIFYALFFRKLNVGVLTALVAIGAAGIVWCAYHYGTLDLGWSWHEFPVAFSRLTFSFFGGVLLFRCAPLRHRFNTLLAVALVGVTACLLAVPLPAKLLAFYDPLMILIVLPLVVIVASRVEPSGPMAKALSLAGLTSYAVYVLHYPIGQLTMLVIDRFDHDLERFHQIDSILFMPALLGVAWLADRHYDRPVRAWLSRRASGMAGKVANATS
jgi:peptidoglycan/LPS O-acetylase OafA/YrhL